MSQPFDQELVMCGEFLSMKDPYSPLYKLEGVDGQLRLKDSVNGLSAGDVDVSEKRNDGSLDEAKKDIGHRQEVRDTKGSKEVVPVGHVEDGTPKTLSGKRADSEWKVPENVIVQSQEALKEFLTCEDEGQDNTKEQVVDQQVNDSSGDIAANQGSNAQKTPLWKLLTCQDPEPEAVEVQMLETIEKQAQGTADCIPAEQDNFAVEKTMLWEFLTCTSTDQAVETVEAQVQEAGKQPVQDTPEREVVETVDVVPTDQAVIIKKNALVACKDTAKQQVNDTENPLLWEFLTCKSQVQEILECHLPENSESQVLDNVNQREQSTAETFRADQVEMAETKMFIDFLTCQDLTVDDDPQLRRAIEGTPAPDQAATPQTQSDGNLAADQVEATKKPNDDVMVEVKKVDENGNVAQITKSQSKVAPEEKDAAPDKPTLWKLATKPPDSKLKVSVTTAEIRRWAESRDKRQIKAVYRSYGVNPKAVIRMEGQVAIPDPKEEDHVILKVEASTVSVTDCLLRRGVNFDMFSIDELPATPGCDVVGYIVKLGPKANSRMNDFTYGDRVAALVRKGGNARYISVPASDLVRVPRSCDSVQAVCMVSIFSTAYLSLKVISSNKPMFSLEGKRVLVVGGMDPVGQALIQMLTKAKADPVFVTAPEYHHTYIRSVLGAYPLPEKAEEWTQYVTEKMDFVFDGECEDHMSAAHSALNKDGQVVCFGTRSYLKAKEVSAFGASLYAHYNNWNVGTMANTTNIDIWESFQKDRTAVKRHLTALFQLLKAKHIHARIARRVTLAEVADAQARLEKEEFNGAVVCLPWKKNPPRPEGGGTNPAPTNVGSW